MITQSFAKFLLANVPITSVTTEIRPLKLDEGHADPAIVYAMGEDSWHRLTSGFSSMGNAVFYVDCYSSSYNTVKSLAEIVSGELTGYVGAIGDHQAEQIDNISEQDIFEDETKLYRVAMQFEVWYLIN